jgi:MFS family permease
VPGDVIDLEAIGAAPPPAAPPAHDPYAALRSSNYRRFAAGFLLSSLGLQMLATALPWEVYLRTGDPLDLGLLGLARALPVVALALPAGHVADAHDRRWVLVGTQTAFAVLLLATAAASWLSAPLWVFFILVTLTACTRAFNGTSRGALLPLIVRADQFQNAATWNSLVFFLSAAAGPLLAGWMVVWAGGRAWPVYAVAACGCAAFAAAGALLRPRDAERAMRRFSLASMAEGFAHVRRERVILAAITLDLLAVLVGGATALLPVYAKDILDVGPVGLGWLRAAPHLGAVAMAVALAHRRPVERAGRALLWAVAAFGAATIVFGVSTSFWLSIATLFVLGAVDNISVVIRHVLVQARTPDHLRGRVAAVNSVFIESSNELGAFESGVVARLAGPVWSVVSGGIGTIVTVALVAWWSPALRHMGRADGRPGNAGR